MSKEPSKYSKLNKIFGDAHICEIQKEFSNYEPLCENSECEKCPLGVGDAVCLKHVFETKWKVQAEYQELKKASDLAKRKITYLLYIKNCPTYEKFADGFYKRFDDCPNEEEYNILKRWMNNSNEEDI